MTSIRKKSKEKKETLKELLERRRLENHPDPVQQELDLSSADNQDKILTSTQIDVIKKELFDGIKNGIDEEIRQLPKAQQKKVDKTLLEELLLGIKEGIDAEFKDFSENQSKDLKTIIGELGDKITDAIEPVKISAGIIDEISEDNAPPTPPLISDSREPLLKRKDPEKIIRTFLKSNDVKGAPNLNFGQKAKNFLTQVAIGALPIKGAEESAQNVIDEKNRKEQFVQQEMSIGQERFKGKSSREIRKTLSSEYKNRQDLEKEILSNNERLQTYKDSGYSDDQIRNTKEYKQRDFLVEKIKTTQNSKISEKETLVDNSTNNSTSTSEETVNEQSIDNKKLEDIFDKQLIVLTDIRDILTKSSKKSSENNQDGSSTEDSGSSLLDTAGSLGKSVIGRAGKLLPKAGSLLKGAAGFAIPAAIMGAAGMGVDSLLGSAGVGKDVTVDQEKDDKNWDRASFTEKLQSAPARGVEKVAGFLGLDNLQKEAKAGRIKSESDYLDKKETLNIDSSMVEKPKTDIKPALMERSAPKDPTIIVQSPPPVVIPSKGEGSKYIPMPFTNGIKNSEPSVNSYLVSRYS